MLSVVDHDLFQYNEIVPHISSWQSGSYKHPLIQQIAHAAFDPGDEAALSLRKKNSLAYSGAVTWNSLTDDIKSTEDVIAFKTKVSNNMRDSLSL